MNTLGTGATTNSGDTWIRFMKLAEEARVRNSGLGAQVKTIQRAPKVKNALPAYPSFPLVQPRSSANTAFSKSTPNIHRRIVGGQFDAYA